MKANKWIDLPNLRTSRTWNCAARFNHQWIYIFYGSNGNKIVQTIERLNIMYPKSWYNIVPKIDESHDIKEAQAFQINRNDILIFGGSKYTYVFHSLAKISEVRKTADVINKYSNSYSGTSAPIVYHDQLFAIDNQRYLHIYSIKYKTWEYFDRKMGEYL